MVFEPIIKRIHAFFFRDVIGSAPVRRELTDITLGNSFCKTVVWPVVCGDTCINVEGGTGDVRVCCVRVRCMRACVVCVRACRGGNYQSEYFVLKCSFLTAGIQYHFSSRKETNKCRQAFVTLSSWLSCLSWVSL